MNMSPDFAASFKGARPAAQHCPELTERGPRPEERAENTAAWCRHLGYELVAEFTQLFSGEKMHVTIAEPERLTGSEVFEKIGAVAVNNLLRCGGDDHIVLLSLDFATAIALTDCSFGGEGEMPDDVPAQLPRSAGLLVEQFAGLVAQTIALVSGTAEIARGDLIARSESVKRLKPFAPDARIAMFKVTMAMGAFNEWTALLAVPEEGFDAFLPGMNGNRPSRRRGVEASDGTAGAFAQMPLPLEAILGEFTMSLSKLEGIAPGDEIPLSIPRDLPLRVGNEVLAHGLLGTLENRMALKLTRLGGASQNAGQKAGGAVMFTPAFSNPQAVTPDDLAAASTQETPVSDPAQRETLREQAHQGQKLQGLTA